MVSGDRLKGPGKVESGKQVSLQSWTGETFIAPASSNPVLDLGLKVTPPWQATVGEEILCVA